MGDHVVTINAGSSSVKFALFAVDAVAPRLVASGQAEGLGASPCFHARIAGEESIEAALTASNHEEAIVDILDWMHGAFPEMVVGAIGHRVVHGGVEFSAPVVIEVPVLTRLRTLIPLAPLHQPHNVAGLEAAHAAFPHVPQVACFDTAFHRGHDFINDAYALPRAYYDRGLRRFSFHGLSYEFIAHRLREIDPARAAGRVIVAHLGNGASLCAMKNYRSVASSMGFSALEGLPMGTRCGQINPGLLLYLLQHDGMSADALSHLLYEQSGLLGLSGISHDMRTLEGSTAPEARDAVDCFIHRIKMEIGALAAIIGGLDALVFTGGIGEHSAYVRAGVVSGMDWLGLTLDREANARNGAIVSSPASTAPVYVTPTDEEAMIARHAIDAVGLAMSVAA